MAKASIGGKAKYIHKDGNYKGKAEVAIPSRDMAETARQGAREALEREAQRKKEEEELQTGRADYEERRQARIDRMEARARASQAESDQKWSESSKMIDAIPMGQPMMPDHYSYRSDRNYRERAHKKAEKAHELSKKAEYQESRAEAAKNNKAISSDDPQALSKLKSKAQDLEASSKMMKDANAYYKKNNTLQGFTGMKQSNIDKMEAHMNDMKARGYGGDRPFASYSLSNTRAEIGRINKRIAALTKAATIPAKSYSFSGGSAAINKATNRIEFTFPGKPSTEVRNTLKRNGFRWAPSAGAWTRRVGANSEYIIERVMKELGD